MENYANPSDRELRKEYTLVRKLVNQAVMRTIDFLKNPSGLRNESKTRFGLLQAIMRAYDLSCYIPEKSKRGLVLDRL